MRSNVNNAISGCALKAVVRIGALGIVLAFAPACGNTSSETKSSSGGGQGGSGGGGTGGSGGQSATGGSAGTGACAGPKLGSKSSWSAGDHPSSVVVADFDKDGKPDLAAPEFGTQAKMGSSVAVLINAGDATFPTAAHYPSGENPYWLASADFNGDGYPDLAVASYNQGATLPGTHSAVRVLINNKDGTFATAKDYYPDAVAQYVDVGDFNGDTKPDLLVSNLLTGQLAILLNSGDGTFAPPVEYSGGGVSLAIAADMNSDGHLDAVILNDAGPGTQGIGVMLNAGDGTLGAVSTYAAGQLPNFLLAGDFNGDGYPDIAVTNAGDGTLGILINNKDGTVGAQTAYPTGQAPAGLASGDVDGDGILDIAVANGLEGSLGVFIGKGDGTFAPQVTFTTDSDPYAVALADLDGNGGIDAVVSTGYQKSTVTTLLDQCHK